MSTATVTNATVLRSTCAAQACLLSGYLAKIKIMTSHSDSTPAAYLRYPHVNADLVTFVARDDVWVAPVTGGQAWRVSAENLPAKNPRFTPDGSALVWTVSRGVNFEVVTAPLSGGHLRQLTYFGATNTRMRGFTPAGDALVSSAFEQTIPRLLSLYAVNLSSGVSEALPYGPADTLAYGPQVGDERPLVLASVYSREPAWWKRYRGGTSGKLWIDADGSGEFARLVPEIDGNLVDPMWVDGRIAFLSDHEGYGNVYSVLPDGSDLRRHTDHEGFYVRHASTDGRRVVFESAGNLFVLDSLESDPRELQITLPGARPAVVPRSINLAHHIRRAVPNESGSSCFVEAFGSVHEVSTEQGPTRTVFADQGVRARLVSPVAGEHVAYVADDDGEEALYISPRHYHADEGAQAGHFGTVPQEQPGAENPMSNEGSDQAHFGGDIPAPVSARAVNHVGDVGATTVAGAERTETTDEGVAPSDGNKFNEAHADAATAGQLPLRRTRIHFPETARACAVVTSPDAQRIAVATEQGHLWLVDVAEQSVNHQHHSPLGAIEDVSFSPDSRYLAFAATEPSGTERRQLLLLDTATSTLHEVTDGRFDDFAPTFTDDGKFLAFLSDRSFDPVYNKATFDLSFPVTTKVFMLALAADTQSPLGPFVEGKASTAETATSSVSTKVEREGDEATGEGQPKVKKTRIDLDGLTKRIFALPVPQSNYTHLAAVPGGLFWLDKDLEGTLGDGRATSESKPASTRLVRCDFDTAAAETLVDNVQDYAVSGDRKTALVLSEGALLRIPTSEAVKEGSPLRHDINLGSLSLSALPAKVWLQEFNEAWRLQRDFYWDPNLAGLDWEAVGDAYRPLVERLGSDDDLVDLLWELHGELGTSHAYVTPKPRLEQAGEQGKLGAAFKRTDQGYQVVNILEPEVSDPGATSPLLAAGVGVHVGDIIVAVNGVSVANSSLGELLKNAGGKVTELAVRSGADGTLRYVAVVPLKNENQLRYQNWVQKNRAFVREASDGRFGYLHVPDMAPRGWAEFARDLDREFNKDAVVIDVRRNGGGHTSQLVAELIGRKISAWCVGRGAPAESYPSTAPRGPLVLLTDEFAGSDGDIITQTVKIRGIGPVIGTRTWGGVVGIDGKFDLMDGTSVTQPRYAYWFTKNVGFSVENYGVDPDIEVTYPPHAYVAGEDPQLQTALGVLREMNEEIPTAKAPQLSGFASKRPMPLPPRPQNV